MARRFDPENPDADAATDGGMPTTIALHKLPVQLRMLVRVMGEAAAYRFVQWRGGTPYTVPMSVRSRQFSALVEVVGTDASMALVAELAGQTLQLPKYDGVLRQLRHQRVIELRGQDAKHHEIAMATGYGVRQVINILNAASLLGLDDADLQGDLFGGEDAQAEAPEVAKVDDAAEPTAHNPFGLGVASEVEKAPEAV